MEWITQLLAWLKQPTKVVATIFVVALALSLFPQTWLDWLRVSEFRDSKWLGLILLGCGVFLAIEGVLAIVAWIRRRTRRIRQARETAAAKEAEATATRERVRKEREAHEAEAAAQRERGLKFLADMTASEREWCRKFIEAQARTYWLNAEHGTVSELVRRGVIYQSNPHAHIDLDFQAWGAYFTMNDWAWEHLNKNPALIADNENNTGRGRRR